MVRFHPLFLALAAAFAVMVWFAGARLSAQDSTTQAQKSWTVPKQKNSPALFSADAAPLDYNRAIRMLAPEEMTEADRSLEAEAESGIAERAGYADMAFNEGKWSYRELVCPAFPNHMFLRFTRNNGAGDVSLFSASAPRNGEGRVRVIPIQRRGYSLFSPAPINALTIAAFNHIRAEEHADAVDWAGMALCYAALAGANPGIGYEPSHPGSLKNSAIMGPILQMQSDGGADIQLTDISTRFLPMDWDLFFNAKGRLLRAVYTPASVLPVRPVPASNGKETTVPVPGGPYRLVESSASPASPDADKPAQSQGMRRNRD